MTQRTATLVGAPCWIDLLTSHPEEIRSFYEELFGWTSEDMGAEYGGYITFSQGGLPVAGAMRNANPASPDRWTVYLSTPDARATADAAVANGGGVLLPAMDVMSLGTMALLTDAGQAVIGVWQPGQHSGFGVLGEPGTPDWFELHTPDYDAVVAFYRDVFRWDAHASDTPYFRYTTLGEGEGMLAGIMDATACLPQGAPAAWSVYFAVQDADAALAKVTELGGTVLMPAVDTPYGRLAQAADPTGAPFKLRCR